MDSRLHQGMRNMSTIQKLDAQTQNTDLPHPSADISSPIQTSRFRPHHRTTEEQRLRRNPDNSRSWMLKSSHLPSVQNHYHRTPDRIPIPSSRVLLVRTPTQDH